MLYNALPSITSLFQASKNVNCAEPEVQILKGAVVTFATAPICYVIRGSVCQSRIQISGQHVGLFFRQCIYQRMEICRICTWLMYMCMFRHLAKVHLQYMMCDKIL